MLKGIEGLRAWLAWTVVFSHIAEFGGLPASMEQIFEMTGNSAVSIFIVISGFVIAHLIIEKKEPFLIYIVRRFLRIYPCYLLALIFSIMIAPLTYQAILGFSGTPLWVEQQFTVQQGQFNENFTAHLVAHLSLLQGMLPNSILPQSQYMFLAPAWSLSLEWQFYFIAPFWIFALRKFPPQTIGVTLVAAGGYKYFLAGMFFSPSFLPGASLLFLLGIATRFWFPSAPRLDGYPFVVALGLFGLVILDKQLITLWVWVATVAYLLQAKVWNAVDSRIARAAGMRSYAVYIIHFPVLSVALFVLNTRLELSGPVLLLALAIVTILGTAILSEIIHRWIEVPAIELGKSIGRQRPGLLTVE
jgi:peptidoglycan/LPS O-acetylase OafA/YrhL